MEKFIPYKKLSKKEKRKINQARRQTWGELNPLPGSPKTARSTTERGRRIGRRNFRILRPNFCFIVLQLALLSDQRIPDLSRCLHHAAALLS